MVLEQKNDRFHGLFFLVVSSVGGFEAGKIGGNFNLSVLNGFRFFWFSKSKFSLVKTGVRFYSGSNSVLFGFKKAIGLVQIGL